MQFLKRILELADSQGLNQKSLAKRAGINYGHFRRVLASPRPCSPAFLDRVAAVLGVTADELNPFAAPHWTRFHKSDQVRLSAYHEQLANAKSILTLMKSIDSYLQHDWMLDWSNRDWLNIENWESHKQIFLPYVHQQRVDRGRSNAVQRLAFPFDLLKTASFQNEHWLAQIRRGLGEFEDVACVTPVRDWKGLQQSVSSKLPVRTWDKLCIIDDSAIYIHLDSQFYLSCSHEPTVKTLELHCELSIHQQEAEFPKNRFGSKPDSKRLSSLAFSVQSQIEKLLVDREAQEVALMRYAELWHSLHFPEGQRLRRYPTRRHGLRPMLGLMRDTQSHREKD